MKLDEIAHSAEGLAFLRRAFEQGGVGPGIGRTLGISGVSADPGKVVLQGKPTEDHQNPAGTAHGGYIATMLDAAMALAVQSCVPPGTGYATTDLNIQFTKPVPLNAEKVFAVAEVIQLTRSRAVVRASLATEAGDAKAYATGSFSIGR